MEPEKEKVAQGALPVEEGEEGASAPSKKKKLIILIVAAVVVLTTVPAVLYFMGVFTPQEKSEKADKKDGKKSKKEAKNLAPPVHMQLDEFLVNLNTSGKQSRFLKLTVELELKSEEEKAALEPYLPRIRDSFQIYLRELRPEDLIGSAATYRLKEELMLRLVKVIYPLEVNDILFKDIIIQ